MRITRTERYYGLIVFCILLAVNWLSNYSRLAGFGLYEDDYWYVANSLNHSTHDLMSFLGGIITDFERGEGRIVGKSLPLILIHFIYNLAGLKALFITGFLLVTVNSYIIFAILRRNYHILLGLITAVLFLAFPADTTRPFITHIYQLQLSLFFVLVGFLFLEKRRYLVSYLFAIFSLLTYENAFLVFLFAPLLVFPKWNREIYRKAFWHLVICMVMILGIFIMRKLGGEDRVASLSMVDFAKKTFAASFIGPATVMFSFVISPIQSLLSLFNNAITIGLGSIGLFLALVLFYPVFTSDDSVKYQFKYKYFACKCEMHENINLFLRLLLVSVLMLLTSYLFSFTHYPPTVLKGRMTSVHFAASIGGSLFFANILYLILFLLKKYKMSVLAVIAFFLALLMGYSNIIQKDYKNAWKYEQSFWKDASALVSDVKDNSVILISNKDLDSTSYIITHSWAMPLVLSECYRFPETWVHPPKVKRINSWNDIKFDSLVNQFFFIADYPFMYEQRDTIYLEDNNTIFLKKDANKLIRSYDSLVISNHTLHLKPMGASVLDTIKLRKTGVVVFGKK
jgi:hypothetical protein